MQIVALRRLRREARCGGPQVCGARGRDAQSCTARHCGRRGPSLDPQLKGTVVHHLQL